MGLRGGRAVAGDKGAAITGVGGGTKAGGDGEPNDIITSIQVWLPPGLGAVGDIVIDIRVIAALVADFLLELGDRVIV